MSTDDVQELEMNASKLVRRAAAGRVVVVTASGVPRARVLPVETKSWGRWEEISDIFSGPSDPDWRSDLKSLDADA